MRTWIWKPGENSILPWLTSGICMATVVAGIVTQTFGNPVWRAETKDEMESAVGVHHHHIIDDVKRSR